MLSTARRPLREPTSEFQAHRLGAEPAVPPVEDESRPARGIVIACGISLAFWLTLLALLA
jgi:hypothetical protein